MKNLKFLALALALLLGLSACHEEALLPEIKLGQTSVQIPSDGSTVMVGYQITNAVEGEKISIDGGADWLTISTAKVRSIELSAEVNDTNESRSTTLTVNYKGAKSVQLLVSQENYTAPLTVTISQVESTEVYASVTTADAKLTWIPMVCPKYYFDGFTSDDLLFKDDMEYFKYVAGNQNMTVEDFVATMLYKGSNDELYISNLAPSTEYVLYVYGMNDYCERTTSIVHAVFTTEEVYQGDITFTFDVIEEDYVLDFYIEPSHRGVDYAFGVATSKELEEWKAAYGDDLRTAIQRGDIDASIERLMNYGFIDSREDYHFMYTESDVMDYGYLEAAAGTHYTFWACKWDEQCNLMGEVSTYDYTTEPVTPSDNQITLVISDLSQSQVTIRTSTTNNDPYVVMPIRTSDLADLNGDDEIFEYLYNAYDYLISEYTFKGNTSKTFSRLKPTTEYTLLYFGCKAATLTTAIGQLSFMTTASGNPADCTFEMYIEPDVEDAWVEITPSDKGHFYMWLVCPADFTASDARAYITMIVENAYESDYRAFASWELEQGDVATTVWDLSPDTEYKLGIVIMDYDSFQFLSDMVFSPTFRTKEFTYADIDITLNYGPYYDIRELLAAGATNIPEDALEYGDAILPLGISLDGNYDKFYYNIYNNNLLDTSIFTDETFYAALEYGCTEESAYFTVDYDKDQTIVAVAFDFTGKASRMVRELIHPTAEGASPASEFLSLSSKALRKASVVEWTSYQHQPVVAPRSKSLSTELSDKQRSEAKAKIADSRKASAKAEVEAAQMRKRNSVRRIPTAR